MTNPPVFPKYAKSPDECSVDTFASVGMAISEWEAVELRLAQLYSFFASGDPDGPAIQEYGEGKNIFVQRASGLNAAAELHFIRSPNQDHEAEFERLVTSAIALASQRNNVAHGIVMPVTSMSALAASGILIQAGTPQWLLLPTYYDTRRHGSDGLPEFALSSVEIKHLARLFFELGEEIAQFTIKLSLGSQQDGCREMSR